MSDSLFMYTKRATYRKINGQIKRDSKIRKKMSVNHRDCFGVSPSRWFDALFYTVIAMGFIACLLAIYRG